MRTIQRDIVGGFIFSKDDKILLGKNRPGGVYEGSYVIPGGGVEPGETNEQALRREMLEETGIDTDLAEVTEINRATGQHEKTLQDIGERVLVMMSFYDYRVLLAENATDVAIHADSDWMNPEWFSSSELVADEISSPTRRTLRKIGFLKS